MLRIFLIFFIVVFSQVLTFAQQERKFIRQGNREYEKAIIDSLTVDTTRYQNAEVEYRKALEKDPNNWDAIYNLANSLFKQGKYEDAAKQYMAAAGMQTDDKQELAMAYHNLGNSFLQTNKLNEAVDAFKNSLRNSPNDYETKYNLAWAQEKLKQQQNQQQDQDQDKENQDQENDDQQQNKNSEQKEQDQQEQQKEQEQQQQQNQQQQQAQQQEQQKDQISKEDAMRILEALQNDEKKVQDKVQKQKVQPKKRTTQKDW